MPDIKKLGIGAAMRKAPGTTTTTKKKEAGTTTTTTKKGAGTTTSTTRKGEATATTTTPKGTKPPVYGPARPAPTAADLALGWLPGRTQLAEVQIPAPTTKPKATPEPRGHHTTNESAQHVAHYGVMAGEVVEVLAHEGGGHLGHQVGGAVAPALKVLGPAVGGWQLLNALGTSMDPFASHDKALTQFMSGGIQMLGLGLGGSLGATVIEAVGQSEREEVLHRRAAIGQMGLDFDTRDERTRGHAMANWIEELGRCGANPEEARALVDQWAERNDPIKQWKGIGEPYRNQPTESERKTIVEAYLHRLATQH